MAEEAVVTLRAVDDISTPVLKAVASMQRLQAALNDIVKTSGQTSVAASESAGAMTQMAAASESSVVPHRAAHQALTLVTLQLAQMAGASASADAGLRVLDSVLFAIVATGGALSLGMTAVIAAVGAAGAVFGVMAESSKKAREELEKIVKAQTDAAISSDNLSGKQRQLAAIHAAELGRSIDKLKEQIGDENSKLQELAKTYDKVTVVERGLFYDKLAHTTATQGSTQEILKERQAILALELQLGTLQKQFRDASEASKGMSANTRLAMDPIVESAGKVHRALVEQARDLEMAASEAEKLGHALGDLNVDQAQVINLANRMGLTYVQAAQIMVKQNGALKSGIESVAETIGATLGNAISGAQNSWQDGLKSMIGAVFDAATQVVLAAAVMNEAISSALIPGSFVGILAMVGVLQGMKAAAVAALSGAQKSANAGGAASAPTAVASSVASGAGSAPAGAVAGGSPVATAQQSVANNITINLPVQAMDLSGISDMQMKDLAFRVGRALREAAAMGQFSLA